MQALTPCPISQQGPQASGVGIAAVLLQIANGLGLLLWPCRGAAQPLERAAGRGRGQACSGCSPGAPCPGSGSRPGSFIAPPLSGIWLLFIAKLVGKTLLLPSHLLHRGAKCVWEYSILRNGRNPGKQTSVLCLGVPCHVKGSKVPEQSQSCLSSAVSERSHHLPGARVQHFRTNPALVKHQKEFKGRMILQHILNKLQSRYKGKHPI